MKMTVIVDTKGGLVAAQHGSGGKKGQEAGLFAGPGQKLHEIDVPDEIAHIRDPHEFATKVKAHLPKT